MERNITEKLKLILLLLLMFVTVSCSLIDEKTPPIDKEYKEMIDGFFYDSDELMITKDRADVTDEYLNILVEHHKNKDYEALRAVLWDNDLEMNTSERVIK